MVLVYKVVIIIVTFLHLIGFAMGVFMPESMMSELGVESADGVLRMTVHFGLLLGIFSTYLTVATVWTFKGKKEGIQLGLVAGLCMTAAFIFDAILIGGKMEYMLLAMGVVTTVTAYMALRAGDESAETAA